MMKKTTYIFLIIFFLTIFLAFVYVKVKPPFNGTIFVNRNIITPEDPTSFKSLTAAGSGQRKMLDRRIKNPENVNARLFTVEFDDGQRMEVQVNPEFDEKEAFEQAKKYSLVIGQMPFALRKDIETVLIHAGKKPFGGGPVGLLIHTGLGEWYVSKGILAETLYHEASHASLDRYHARNEDWLAAQKKDGKFISRYAKKHPIREDVAETYLLYFAYRYKPHRIDKKLKETLEKTIPNRIAYFDSLKFNMHPVEKPKAQDVDANAKRRPKIKADNLKTPQFYGDILSPK
jgi:hypothetical protein